LAKQAKAGSWHTIYTRMNRWSKSGVLDQVFERLQREQIVRIKIEAVKMDSIIVKVHPDGTGALKKWTPGHRKIPRRMDHQDSYGCRGCSNGHNLCALPWSGFRCCGRAPVAGWHRSASSTAAPDHGQGLRGRPNAQLALDFGFIPVDPPKSNRLDPWQYDRAMYRKRNEIERLFRRLKGFRRIFSRFEKLDALFLGFLTFALVVEALR